MSTSVQDSTTLPVLGQLWMERGGPHTPHCSAWYCGKAGYQPRVLAATHLVPILFQEEQEEEGQEHLTTFRISFSTIHALSHLDTFLFCPLRTVSSLNCFETEAVKG